MKFRVVHQPAPGHARSPFRVVEQTTGREVDWINRYLDREVLPARHIGARSTDLPGAHGSIRVQLMSARAPVHVSTALLKRSTGWQSGHGLPPDRHI
jgi:hypothetical protein